MKLVKILMTTDSTVQYCCTVVDIRISVGGCLVKVVPTNTIPCHSCTSHRPNHLINDYNVTSAFDLSTLPSLLLPPSICSPYHLWTWRKLSMYPSNYPAMNPIIYCTMYQSMCSSCHAPIQSSIHPPIYPFTFPIQWPYMQSSFSSFSHSIPTCLPPPVPPSITRSLLKSLHPCIPQTLFIPPSVLKPFP